MGIFNGRDLYSQKYTTAEISDSANNLYVVPIKHTIGNYFLCTIRNQLYVFDLTGAQTLTRRESMTKSFDVIRFDTRHYRSITDKSKELELVLKKNGLPKADIMLSNVFKILASKERSEFESHSIIDLVKEINEFKNKKIKNLEKDSKYSEQARSIVNFLDNLGIDEIVTSLRSVSEFIEDDLKVTDAAFMGNVLTQFQRTDVEHKKVTNTPIGPKKDWMKFLLIMFGIGLVLAVMYLAYEQGAFDGLLSAGEGLGDFNFNIPQIGPSGQSSPSDLMNRYPTPEALKAAVDSGDLSYDALPDNIKTMIDGVETPTTTP